MPRSLWETAMHTGVVKLPFKVQCQNWTRVKQPDSLFWSLDACQLCFLPFWFSFILLLIQQGFTQCLWWLKHCRQRYGREQRPSPCLETSSLHSKQRLVWAYTHSVCKPGKCCGGSQGRGGSGCSEELDRGGWSDPWECWEGASSLKVWKQSFWVERGVCGEPQAQSAVDKAAQCNPKTKGKMAPRSQRTMDNSSPRTPQATERRSSFQNSKIFK